MREGADSEKPTVALFLEGRALAQAVDQACRQAFVNRGYDLPRRGAIRLQITPECWGWIGLNLGRSDDNTTVHPFVGIHCPIVQRIASRCHGESYRAGSVATFAVPFIEAAPDAPLPYFRFYQEDPLEPGADELAAMVDRYARPFMIAHAAYDRLIAALTPAALCGGGRPQRLAAMYYLTEGPERSLQYLDEVLTQLRGERSDGIADSVARFSEAFEAMMARGNAENAQRSRPNYTGRS